MSNVQTSTEILQTVQTESPAVEGGKSGSVKEDAVTKLEGELEKKGIQTQDRMVLEHLVGRCREDEGLSKDVLQEHKTYEKCFDYIQGEARKYLKNKNGYIDDPTVFEWAEDYYHKDDKAEEEKKAKEAAERKKREAERRKKAAERKSAKKDKDVENSAEKPKPKKNAKEMDGQMDLFSIMGTQGGDADE